MTASPPPPHSITVSGRGSATAVPEHFLITLGIEVQRPTVREAYAVAGTAMTAVQAQVRAHQVPAEAMASSSLDVRPESHWQEGVGTVVTGYTVSSSLQVRLPYGDVAQQIIAAVVDAGNDHVRLQGLHPHMGEAAAARTAARGLAWADARQAAQLYAELAGRSLGPLLALVEGAPQPPGGVPLMARALASSDAGLPVTPGESTITAAVTATWALLEASPLTRN